MPKTAEEVTVDAPSRRRALTLPRLAWLIGPALVAGVAYLDPGNVASNMTAGARYGYLLVWVVVIGNVMAWLIQYLSAKLGIVTGESLPEVLGRRIRNRWGRRAYWLQAELVAMATDLAEVIGGAVALNLLFGVPLLWGGLITGTVSIVLLVLQSKRGPRTFEFVIMGLLLIIAIGFSVGVFIAPPDPAALAAGLVPRFEDANSVLLAASMQQTVGLEDGSQKSAKGANLGAGFTYKWKKQMDINIAYDLNYWKFDFGTPSANRGHTGTATGRTDVFHGLTAGIAYAL